MDAAYLSALSALAGSVVGGLITGFTTWIGQRTQARTGRLAADLLRRQELFKDFIAAASKSYADAVVSTEPKIPEVVALWAMVSRMRVLCSPATASAAGKTMHKIMDTFFEPPKDTAELRALMKRAQGVDPLQEFSEAAREELQASAI